MEKACARPSWRNKPFDDPGRSHSHSGDHKVRCWRRRLTAASLRDGHPRGGDNLHGVDGGAMASLRGPACRLQGHGVIQFYTGRAILGRGLPDHRGGAFARRGRLTSTNSEGGETLPWESYAPFGQGLGRRVVRRSAAR